MIRGSRALVTWPKVLLLSPVPGLFLRKLLVTLNASARISILCVSSIAKVLDRDASNCHVFGPTTDPTPTLRSEPEAGFAKAAGLRYLSPPFSRYGSARI